MLRLLALNKLGTTDIVFFVVLAVIVALIVAIYFLIPVFNKKQYQEQRENLKKREEAFKANAKVAVDASDDTTSTQISQTTEQENSDK